MANFAIEQALYRREHEDEPRLIAKSSGFLADWQQDAERLVLGFGARTGGVTCSLAVFACPLNDDHIAVVRVADREVGSNGWPALAFHFLVIPRLDYEKYLGDPFLVSGRAQALWTAQGELPSLTWPCEPPPRRTVAQVQAVLKRVKSNALPEDEDPEAAIERTIANSESPTLLGGVQILVDGGKLVYFRTAPDNDLVQGLWTLLPHSVRGKARVASFAFTNDLDFDVIVTPRVGEESWEGFTTEDQAGDYPAGSYEYALQAAAEAGDQPELDAVFAKRSSGDTVKLAWTLVVAMIVLVLASRLFLGGPPPRAFTPQRQAMVAAGIVATAAGDPWASLALYQAGKEIARRDQEAQK